jgi:hypothetical protein
MRPDDLLLWLRGQPFHPFRLHLASGQVREVRHPETMRLLRSSLILFTPSTVADVYDHAEMIGLLLIERIEPIEAPATLSRN